MFKERRRKYHAWRETERGKIKRKNAEVKAE